MRSTFTGLEISKRSLFAQQTALQTTGHNIANANTRGYTRQSVDLVAAKPFEAVGMTKSTAPGQVGQGVEYEGIRRIREKFLDDQFINENKNLGAWEVRRDTLEKLESIVNEPSDTGIRQVIEGFWNAWQELSKSPENLTARVLVKEKALALTDAFNHTAKQLTDLSQDITGNIAVKASNINSISAQVATLNYEIFRIEGIGDNANDLRDQRDLLIDDLSKMINISIADGQTGYTVRMGSTELVSGKEVAATVDAASLQTAFSSGNLNSGEVYGMIYSRDVNTADYKFQLDSMINAMGQGEIKVTLPAGSVIPDGLSLNNQTYSGTVADRTLSEPLEVTVQGINGLHALGYTGGSELASGIPFFTLKNGATEWTAENITVNPDIVADVTNISTSLRSYVDGSGNEKVIKGNNDMTLLVAGLRNVRFQFDPDGSGRPILSDGTFDEFFRSIVGEIGVQSQEANRQSSNQKILIDQVDSRRQSISGVSLDEEMSDMIKYQHAYNAAARAMTTFDEMLDKIINSMGVVGR